MTDSDLSKSHLDQRLFSEDHDRHLLEWLAQRPDDWHVLPASSAAIYGWGHNHRGQLAGLSGTKVKLPTCVSALTTLRAASVCGGEQTVFTVTADGRVYASGYGGASRLGTGSDQGSQAGVPLLLEALQHVTVEQVAVNAAGRHALAVTADGRLFSWGEGGDGQLGLGTRCSESRPRLIDALLGQRVTAAACGSAHSACVTSEGALFTWGRGRYGRLGHGTAEDASRPRRVHALVGWRVVQVACGSGDAQTLCLTDDGTVWAWGDGDYGKLGRGGSDGCRVPVRIEALADVGVCRVFCGSQFSAALTRSGSVFTWGKGDYFRLGHGNSEHVRRPKRVQALSASRIVSLAVGSLHCLACSERGEVFAWGDNDEGQLGDGSTVASARPKLITTLSGKHITHVACGSAHSLAWSCARNSSASEHLPSSVPARYHLLLSVPIPVLGRRLVLLHQFAQLLLPLFSQFAVDDWRRLPLPAEARESCLRRVIQTTMSRSRQHGPVIELNRVHARLPLFLQLVSHLATLLQRDAVLLPQRVWKVRLVGESADDCGGAYSETVAEMCDELMTGKVPLLLPASHELSDGFLLNPSADTQQLKLLGVLMGVAVRTGAPLAISIAAPVWKLLCGISLEPSDLVEVCGGQDINSLYGLRQLVSVDSLQLPFSVLSLDGTTVPIQPPGECHRYVSDANLELFIRRTVEFRMGEMDAASRAVRRGLSHVLPPPLLALLSPDELETLVCGSREVPVSRLRAAAVYRCITADDPLIEWLWLTVEAMDAVERVLFLRFVWGRSRLPCSGGGGGLREFVIQAVDRPSTFLPESCTCFFMLKLPRYSSCEQLREKLLYAIRYCRSIDTDEYARVALPGEPVIGDDHLSQTSQSPDI